MTMKEILQEKEALIKKALCENEAVTAWTLNTSETNRDEIYLIGKEVEQTRYIQEMVFFVAVLVDKEVDGEMMTGKVARSFTPEMTEEEIKEQVAEMVFAAGLALNPHFTLDEPRDNGRMYPNQDHDIVYDRKAALKVLRERTVAAVDKEEGVRIASAEGFLTHNHNRETNSLGLEYECDTTRITYELVLLAGKGDDEVESHLIRHERMLDKLEMEETIARYAQYARDNISAGLPKSGKAKVIFTEEALEHFFDYFTIKSMAPVIYNQMSDWKVGQKIVEDVEGDKLTLSFDPELEGGLSTTKYDESGTLLEKFTFIKDGVFEKMVADKRHAGYLSVPTTGFGSNLVIEPGNKSYEELLVDDTYILSRFSSFTPNKFTGGFSGEIRNGLHYKDGKFTPIKGGSVSGKLQEALKKVYLSKETYQFGRYHGPRYIKVLDVDITGE